MRLKLFVFSLLAVTTLVFTHGASAQSRLERLAVPKSQLSDNFWTKHDAGSIIEVNHELWDAFLGKYIKTDRRGINRVAYGTVSSSDKTALKTYLKMLESVDVSTLNRDEQFAYWINLYNANTVMIALDNYPLESIRDVKKGTFDFSGPFNDKISTINSRSLTLNTIESGIVRPIWKDPRLHYVFNCAAISCPNLGKKAYRGKTLNRQLNAAASRFVNDPRGIAIKKGKVTASKIYFWYEEDFGGSHATILKHIRRYANNALKSRLASVKKINKFEYDWALNDAR